MAGHKASIIKAAAVMGMGFNMLLGNLRFTGGRLTGVGRSAGKVCEEKTNKLTHTSWAQT